MRKLFKKSLALSFLILIISGVSVANVGTQLFGGPKYEIAGIQSYYLKYMAEDAKVYGNKTVQTFIAEMPVKDGSNTFRLYYGIKKQGEVIPKSGASELYLHINSGDIKIENVKSDCNLGDVHGKNRFNCWMEKTIDDVIEYPSYHNFTVKAFDQNGDDIVTFGTEVPKLNFSLDKSDAEGSWDKLIIESKDLREITITEMTDGKYVVVSDMSGEPIVSDNVIDSSGLELQINPKTNLGTSIALNDVITFKYKVDSGKEMLGGIKIVLHDSSVDLEEAFIQFKNDAGSKVADQLANGIKSTGDELKDFVKAVFYFAYSAGQTDACVCDDKDGLIEVASGYFENESDAADMFGTL